MNLFNKHSEPPSASSERPWLPKKPSEYTDVIGLDSGRQGWAAFSVATGDSTIFPKERSVDLWTTFPQGALVVVEHAHFQVFQTYKNIAQPLKLEQYWEIRKIAAERDITIRVVFQTLTTSMRQCIANDELFPSVSEGKGTDINDAMAIALYVAHVNEMALMLPRDDFERSPKRLHFDRLAKASTNLLSAVSTLSPKNGPYDCRGSFPELFDVVDAAIPLLSAETNAYLGQKGLFAVACLMLGYDKETGLLSRYTHNGHRYGRDEFSKNAVGNRAPREGSGKSRAMINSIRYKVNGGPRDNAMSAAGVAFSGKCSSSSDPAIRAAGKASWKDARRMHKETWAVIDRITKDFPNLDI